MLLVRMAAASANAAGDKEANGRSLEGVIASSFLFCVVVMQILAGFSKAVRLGAGRAGRIVYHTAFAVTIVHDFFIALLVPASLVWVAVELLVGKRDIETLLAAIVGTLWYGPDRVQNAMTNLIHIRYRRQVLFAALSPYHRYMYGKSVQRQLRRWPWWRECERQAEVWNGRVFSRNAGSMSISDGQLRTIARKGVQMAFTGEADVRDVRVWAAALVADQARFPHSLLDRTDPYDNHWVVFTGYEGTLLRRSIRDITEDWTDYQWKRLATVMDGVKDRGLQHLFTAGWVEYKTL